MKRVLALLSVLAVSVLLAVSAAALDFDPYKADVSWDNAPEGTAYLDILIKLPEDDAAYTSFNAPPRRIAKGTIDKEERAVYEYESLNITSESEIAKYQNGGYVSMTCHYRYLRTMTISGNDKEGYFDRVKQKLELYAGTAPDLTDIHKKYGDLKAAYVDQNGKVLGVTDSFEVMYDKSEPYALVADGGKLTFRIFGSGTFSGIIERFGGAVKLAYTALIIATVSALVILIKHIAGRKEPDETAEGE